MTVLVYSIQKGGCGKTTSTAATGVELAHTGARVLLIDLDPQSNLTQSLGYDPARIPHSVYEVLLDPEPATLEQAIVQTPHGVALLPATLTLAGAELMLAGRIGRELLLRTALTNARTMYDYILIDTPPSLGLFTVNALTAADAVLVPLQAHVLALKAMPQLEETIRLVRQLNPALHIGGILITMMDRRTMLNQAIEDEARKQYGDLVFQTVIPFTIKLAETPAAGEPILSYAPDSIGAKAYRALTHEIRMRHGR